MNYAQLLPILLMFVLFYFLLIRPQKKRQNAVQQMQSSLKKGDKIVTIGGLHGTIDAIDESTGKWRPLPPGRIPRPPRRCATRRSSCSPTGLTGRRSGRGPPLAAGRWPRNWTG